MYLIEDILLASNNLGDRQLHLKAVKKTIENSDEEEENCKEFTSQFDTSYLFFLACIRFTLEFQIDEMSV